MAKSTQISRAGGGRIHITTFDLIVLIFLSIKLELVGLPKKKVRTCGYTLGYIVCEQEFYRYMKLCVVTSINILLPIFSFLSIDEVANHLKLILILYNC